MDDVTWALIILAVVIVITILVFVANNIKFVYNYNGMIVNVYSGFSRNYLSVNGKIIDEINHMVSTFHSITLQGTYNGIEFKANIGNPGNGKSMNLFINGEKVR